MADSKISALPPATTPLAGTELIPIVQGGATTKVAASAFQAPLVSGANIKTVNGNSLLGSGDLTISGGGGTPGGSDTQVQFNDGGAFGGDSGLAFNKTTGKLTVGGKTVTASAPVLDLSQTWNASGVTFTGIKFNVTDTASAAASLLMDLQVGGVSKFKVEKNGAVTSPYLIGVSNSWSAQLTSTSLDFGGPTTTRSITFNGQPMISAYGSNSLSFSPNAYTSVISFFDQVYFGKDSVNVLAQRNGTAAQTKRLYGTYTDASNYRRLTQTMSVSGVAEIKPEGGGTGATGNVLHISGLPTSNPGPGILWNNAGVVNVGT